MRRPLGDVVAGPLARAARIVARQIERLSPIQPLAAAFRHT